VIRLALTLTCSILLACDGLAPDDDDPDDDDAASMESDFEPASGAAPSPSADPMVEGPWNGRFMTAVSEDGLDFTRTGEVLGDQLNVPDLVQGPDGRLFLYFSGWTLGDVTNGTAVAISEDDGATWIWKHLRFDGFDRDPADLSVVHLPEDDLFRLYGTYSVPGENRSTYYAESADGIDFERRGRAFGMDDRVSMVPSVLRVGDEWHLYSNTRDVDVISHATSADGTAFVLRETIDLIIDGRPYFASNAIPVDDGYRLFAYSRAERNIGSFHSTDGWNWESEGLRLELDEAGGLEADWVKDPAVVRRADGSFLMVYATNVPE
jgi:hypothetical protein